MKKQKNKYLKFILCIILFIPKRCKELLDGVIDITENWCNYELDKKITTILSIIIFITTVFISLEWISESISYKYRYDYRKKNEDYWERLNISKENMEIYIENEIVKDQEDEKEWRIENDYLHFLLNKEPRPIDFGPIITLLIAITAMITGLDSVSNSISNLKLPKNTGKKMTKEDANKLFFMLTCWGILLISIIICKRFITDIDKYANIEIPFHLDKVLYGFSTLLLVGAVGVGLGSISSVVHIEEKSEECECEENDKIIDNDNEIN